MSQTAVGSLEMGEHAGETVAYLEHGGLEVRDAHALREHYVRTVADWLERFESNRERLTERLYLVGGSTACRAGRMGVDQILMVRPDGPHTCRGGEAGE